MKKSTWSLVLIGAMGAWASFYPFATLIQGTIDPFLLAFLRFFFAALAIMPLMVVRRSFVLPPKKEWLPLLIVSFFAIAPTAITVIGIKYSNSIVGAILVNTNSLFVALLAPFLIGERMTKGNFFALLIGFMGMACSVLNGHSLATLVNSEYFFGSMLLLVSSIFSALYGMYAKKYVHTYGGLYVTFLTVAIGSILLAIFLFFHGGFSELPSLPPKTVFFSLLIGVVATAIPYVLWSSSLRHHHVNVATSFKLLIPVFATLYSFIFLRETFTVWMFIGLVLTSVGIYLVQRPTFVEPA